MQMGCRFSNVLFFKILMDDAHILIVRYGGAGAGMPQLEATVGASVPSGASRREDASPAARFDCGGSEREHLRERRDHPVATHRLFISSTPSNRPP